MAPLEKEAMILQTNALECAMSNVTFLEVTRVSRAEPIEATAPVVHVREMEAGVWVVHDEDAHKAGRFRERAAAFRFLAEEFSAGTRTVIHMRFSAKGDERTTTVKSVAVH
jgi:D-serine deaminase-like pyridoxal phosphate-dependent protein